MLDRDIRIAILLLWKKGHEVSKIAQSVGADPKSVRRVIASGSAEIPKIEREELLTPHMDLIRNLYADCKGNVVRVHEELRKKLKERDDPAQSIAYSSMTAFCRRKGIGVKEKTASGEYHFKPGEEMQFDTSPHVVEVGGRRRKLQCASLVLCFSRMIFIQLYEIFTRFIAKAFLTAALKFFDGAAARCITDNTNVVVAHGTGKNAVIVPEMVALGDRFGFKFEAHNLGDKNRSAYVERPFDYVENNFYPGRTFKDRNDLNIQAYGWSDDRKYIIKKKLRATPLQLFQIERPHLKKLPIYIPDVYDVSFRTVDVYGWVHLHTNRYSVADQFIGCDVQVREYIDRVVIQRGHEVLAEHVRLEHGANMEDRLPEHKRQRRWKKAKDAPPIPQEAVLRKAAPELSAYIDALKKKKRGRCVRPIQTLYSMYLVHPTDAIVKAVTDALHYGMFDLKRLGRMILRNVGGDFFRFPDDLAAKENLDE